mgnify:FL=1
MRKIRVVQQYVNAANNGGLKTEYEALNNRKNLLDEYEFIPVVLNNCHCGLSLSDIRFYRRAIGKADPDIVHIRGAGMESLNAVLGAKLSGSGKILVTVHGMFSDLVYYSPIKRWVCRYVVEPMIFGLSDGISCVYERAAQRDVFRRYRKKMLPFVYNRMPQYPDCSAEEKRALRKELNLPENARIGIYVGRVTKEKGLSYLVDALKQMDACWPPELCLLIVGNGDYLQEMQSECAALQHAKRVIFAWQQEQIQKYLNASDFFLSPSLHENLSISILEACAAKLPCLVTDVGGNSEIIENGKNGLMIKPYSAKAIVDGIKKMCCISTYIALEKNICKTDYRKFSGEQVDKQLESVYSYLLKL